MWSNQNVSLVEAFEKWPNMVLEWFSTRINIQTRPANLPMIAFGATAGIGDQVDAPIPIDCEHMFCILYFAFGFSCSFEHLSFV